LIVYEVKPKLCFSSGHTAKPVKNCLKKHAMKILPRLEIIFNKRVSKFVHYFGDTNVHVLLN